MPSQCMAGSEPSHTDIQVTSRVGLRPKLSHAYGSLLCWAWMCVSRRSSWTNPNTIGKRKHFSACRGSGNAPLCSSIQKKKHALSYPSKCIRMYTERYLYVIKLRLEREKCCNTELTLGDACINSICKSTKIKYIYCLFWILSEEEHRFISHHFLNIIASSCVAFKNLVIPFSWPLPARLQFAKPTFNLSGVFWTFPCLVLFTSTKPTFHLNANIWQLVSFSWVRWFPLSLHW